jgi:hypothetical protein
MPNAIGFQVEISGRNMTICPAFFEVASAE